jgi:hypothetical protein
MSKFDKYMMTGVIIFGFISFFILGWGFAETQWKHDAVHNAFAHYDVNEYGNTTFKWNK